MMVELTIHCGNEGSSSSVRDIDRSIVSRNLVHRVVIVL
jgi:hypothetical protein